MLGVQEVSIFLVFLAGLGTFLSPCILPLIPMYLSYITGITIGSENFAKDRKKVLINTIMFLIGLGVAIILLQILIGYFANTASKFLGNNLIYNFMGIIIIIFGLHFLGIFRFRYFYSEKRVNLNSKKNNLFISLLMGFLFGFGWTPCMGPILFSVISLVSREASFLKGISYMGIYILGISIPFLFFAIFFEKVLPKFKKLNRFFPIIEKINGIILIIVGILLFLNKLDFFNNLWQPPI